jgi:hypothetical protein
MHDNLPQSFEIGSIECLTVEAFILPCYELTIRALAVVEILELLDEGPPRAARHDQNIPEKGYHRVQGGRRITECGAIDGVHGVMNFHIGRGTEKAMSRAAPDCFFISPPWDEDIARVVEGIPEKRKP